MTTEPSGAAAGRAPVPVTWNSTVRMFSGLKTNGASTTPVPVTTTAAVRIETGPDGAGLLSGVVGGVELGGGVEDPEEPEDPEDPPELFALLFEFALPPLAFARF